MKEDIQYQLETSTLVCTHVHTHVCTHLCKPVYTIEYRKHAIKKIKEKRKKQTRGSTGVLFLCHLWRVLGFCFLCFGVGTFY